MDINTQDAARPRYLVDQQGNPAPSGSAAEPRYGYALPGTLPAGTDRSGTAGTTATALAGANTSRRGLSVQNISVNTIGINEVGGTASIGAPGTYTIAAGAMARISTNRAVSIIASAASSAYTATEY